MLRVQTFAEKKEQNIAFELKLKIWTHQNPKIQSLLLTNLNQHSFNRWKKPPPPQGSRDQPPPPEP